MLNIAPLNHSYNCTPVSFKAKVEKIDYEPIREAFEKIFIETQDIIPPKKEVPKTFIAKFKEWFLRLFSKSKMISDPDTDLIPQINVNYQELVALPADKYGWTELHYLCRDGYTDAVKEFIKKHPDFDINQPTNDGYSYMYLAERNRNTDIVNILARMKSLDLSTTDKGGFNDLHFLCRDGYAEAVRKIIDNHPDFDVNQRTNDGYSYMYLAECNRNTDIVNLLAEIKSLDLSKTDKSGCNDLHFLCRDGYAEAVRKIIDNHPDFDVNQRTNEGYSYMYLARHNHHDNIVNMLAKYL